MMARVVIFLILPGVAATLLADVFPASAGIAALMAAIGALGHRPVRDSIPRATAREIIRRQA